MTPANVRRDGRRSSKFAEVAILGLADGIATRRLPQVGRASRVVLELDCARQGIVQRREMVLDAQGQRQIVVQRLTSWRLMRTIAKPPATSMPTRAAARTSAGR